MLGNLEVTGVAARNLLVGNLGPARRDVEAVCDSVARGATGRLKGFYKAIATSPEAAKGSRRPACVATAGPEAQLARYSATLDEGAG